MKTRFLLCLSLLISLSLLFQNCASENSTNKNSEAKTETPISKISLNLEKQEIAPPFNSVDVPYQNFNVTNSSAQTLNLDNGTTIEIPANAFVDANGNAINSEIKISYREFHTAADILASGIPMKASHNGIDGDMQTAGMFEINASSNNQEVFVAEGKNVGVNMATNVDGDNYDFWELNQESGAWENLGGSTAQPNVKKIAAQKEIANLSKMKTPTPPAKFDKAKSVLNFDLNLDDYPDLKSMKNIFWQFTGNGENPKNNPWVFKEQWTSADIKKGTRGNEYIMVLKSDKKNFSTTVCPSQKGKDFDEALSNYETALRAYKANSTSQQERMDFMKRQTDFVRSFQIQNMGIYNCDALINNPGALAFEAKFDFGPDVPMAHNKVNVYLITNDARSVIAYPFARRKNFLVDSSMDNQLIAILPNNKYATFSQADFDANLEEMKNAKGKVFTFKMNVETEPIESVEDLTKAMAAL
ncbi:MAG: hypothetical protein AB8H03_21110 [Saprospiraceae bacterium]